MIQDACALWQGFICCTEHMSCRRPGSKASQPNLWQERYSVNEARLPHFVTPPLASDILRTGARLCCAPTTPLLSATMLLVSECSCKAAGVPQVLRPSRKHAPGLAGKSVVFLRECCGDAAFEAAAAPDASRSGGSAALLEVRICGKCTCAARSSKAVLEPVSRHRAAYVLPVKAACGHGVWEKHLMADAHC